MTAQFTPVTPDQSTVVFRRESESKNRLRQLRTDVSHDILVTMASQWQVFCFITHRGENIIREWLKRERVPRTQIAIFQAKLDTFERGGPELSPGLISSGPVGKDIYKMKIKGHKGHVQLRPMLCYGPLSPASEITLLVGAIEKGFKLIPSTCITDAQENRGILISDPNRRRREPVA